MVRVNRLNTSIFTLADNISIIKLPTLCIIAARAM